MKENKKILVCGGTGCLSAKGAEIVKNLRDSIREHSLENEVEVIQTGCFGFCEKGPIVKIMPENTFYIEVKPEDAERIIVEDIISEKRIIELLYIDPKNGERVFEGENMEFYKKQVRIALKNCGTIDPESIEQYMAAEGYAALKKILTTMTPENVVKIIKDSGLRGRGGGGYSTGLKWEFASKNISDQKYIVCNADEGDPGAFMDRSILEGDPHSVIEGMIIAGYAIGATEGLVYIRAEYPLAIERLRKAIETARKNKILGENVFGTDFKFDIEIKYGAGAFVCGEETALIHSMEGGRGEPTTKPPYPAESGYWGKPTIVNNVETLANIAQIILKGVDWFRSIGTKNSPGTKVFALAGKINNVGLVEVPMGTTLREVIFEIGGGIKNNKKFKAVQTGGPSGGCLTEKDLDTPIDFDTLLAKGSMMGSGGMIVMDEDDCMVAVSKFYLEFTVDESCGKCAPCRIGNTRLWEILDRITKGEGKEEDIALLKELSQTIKTTSLCGLGQTSPNPVLSTINQFLDEYLEHIHEKKCRAGQCQALRKYLINDKCVGCTACARVCPVACIEGKVKERHVIDQTRCIKCGACYNACKFNAIDVA
ncbi:NADH-quinone oxidoreductase subunit NuoF [Cetobacterium somerae]|uniref:NADH-quinone oxidoreductase subunit NuoF n=1 Tax=Cetobacterium sp. NK01 TaxID=2993530 RepID=UPI002115E08C|nr:NADH-quinone oxidoreductase subunit NuoF [Cetobacterium sp. NK01]MCQ8212529.1 NADH-quinone oxidoreductase subunit NuoF [Cetobacterium sp. NK01]